MAWFGSEVHLAVGRWLVYLELGQDWDELLFSHLSEGGSFQGETALHHDAALPCYVAGSVHIVACHHAHKDAGPLADAHRIWHLFTHRILHCTAGLSCWCMQSSVGSLPKTGCALCQGVGIVGEQQRPAYKSRL